MSTAAVRRRVGGAAEAWEAAFKDTVTTSPHEQAGWLLEALGPRMTTAALGLADARTVRRWRDERTDPREHDVAGRLALLFRVTRAIAGVYEQGAVAAAFLRSANPQLDDEAPLILLADNDPDVVQRDLLAAVRAFLEG